MNKTELINSIASKSGLSKKKQWSCSERFYRICWRST